MTDASNTQSPQELNPDANLDHNLGLEVEKKPKRKPAKKSEKIVAESSEQVSEKAAEPKLELKLDKNTEEKLLEIKKSREALLIKINQIQGRLLSGYSKPLDQSLMALLKQDIALISQTTDLLDSLRP